MRKAAARTLDAVVDAIGQLLGACNAPECANYFANAGYGQAKNHPALGFRELLAGFRGSARKLGSYLRLRKADPLFAEVAPYFSDDIVVARLLEIRRDHGLRISFCCLAGRKAQPRGGPQPKQPVTASADPKQQLLIALERRFEPLLPILETLHVPVSFHCEETTRSRRPTRSFRRPGQRGPTLAYWRRWPVRCNSGTNRLMKSR